MIKEKQFIKIYREHKKEIYLYIFRFTHSHEIAEDLLHDCFENLIKYSQKNIILETTVRAFLYKVAHNLCINYLNKKKSFSLETMDDKSKSLFIQHDDSFSNLEYKDLQGRLEELVSGIDSFSKSVYTMKIELDLSFSEIAENCDVSERTVRRNIQKSLKYFADILEKEGSFD